ncbi:MAG TPA: hypothetical protein VFE33_31645 [Thermoanaerobaculia bacterium]|nr:hypothetical protein [Thermoanaerobaculia bacterium]
MAETRLAWEIYAQHVPSEALVAYAFDERPEGIDPALVERHLAECPQCAAELEMVRSSRLLGEHDEIAVMPQRGAPGRRSRPERGWQAATLAAGLTGLIAIGGWVANVRQVRDLERVAAARTPAVQAAGGALAASGRYVFFEPSTRGLADEVKEVRKSDGYAVLTFNPTSRDVYHEHAFKLRNAAGVDILPESRLGPPHDGAYSVVLPLAALPPGDYVLSIFGADPGAHVELDSHRFRLVP